MTNLASALWITLIGMGMVFFAIVLLWGLMALIVRLTQEKSAEVQPAAVNQPSAVNQPPAEGLAAVAESSSDSRDAKAAAAAAAVAIALEMQKKTTFPPRFEDKAQKATVSGDSTISPWQAAHRTKDLLRKNGGKREAV